ncbi:UNVERIFIED_CONTAM: hypothetical protein Sangu_2609500 [Sesamum angustifolium]|uniref:Uncharacterized protein n=1 Tax=Sesamum angustifolium TaxID=2727405 RepID=A0AAW2J553_9LAMI
MPSSVNPNRLLLSNPDEQFTSLIVELQQQLRDSLDEMEELHNDLSKSGIEGRRVGWQELDSPTGDRALKAEHEVEVEQCQ